MKKRSVLSRLMGYKDAPIILLDEATAGEKADLKPGRNFQFPRRGNNEKRRFYSCACDGLIDLTETGKDKAENIFSRHKSLSQALVVMGLSPEAAEENACRVEHVITEEAFEAIKKYFNV